MANIEIRFSYICAKITFYENEKNQKKAEIHTDNRDTRINTRDMLQETCMAYRRRTRHKDIGMHEGTRSNNDP